MPTARTACDSKAIDCVRLAFPGAAIRDNDNSIYKRREMPLCIAVFGVAPSRIDR
jgi:hypothetical protein